MRVEWIGQRLGLRNHVIDEGKRMFQLAAQRNFTTGRKTSHVAAACMYIVCRRDKEPYLLLDFADALHHASYRQCTSVATFDARSFARRAQAAGWKPRVDLLLKDSAP
jgi:transcription factor IIIB subunit 2